ncbi:hypothetical protein [Paenibacillus sp. NPDC055715]
MRENYDVYTIQGDRYSENFLDTNVEKDKEYYLAVSALELQPEGHIFDYRVSSANYTKSRVPISRGAAFGSSVIPFGTLNHLKPHLFLTTDGS